MSEDRLPTFPSPRIRPEQKRLTREQRAYAQQFNQKYITLMRSLVEVDEAEAEEHLRHAYLVADLAPPRIRWFDSPMAFLLAVIPPDIRSKMGLPVEDRGEMSIWVDVKGLLVNEHPVPI